MKNRGGVRGQLLILLVLTILFFHKVLFASTQKIIAGYDILVYHYYARAFTRASMLKGLLPKWNPYEYAGMPFAADPGNCVFYPLNKFFLVMPISSAIGLNMALHVFIAGTGMLLLARALGLKHSAGAIAAIAFMFSGYFIDRIGAGHEILVMCSAYLPWIFLCCEKASQTARPEWALLGGIAVGLQVLTGASQPVLYTGIFLFVYAVVRNLHRERGSRVHLMLRDFGYLVIVGAVGVGLSAIQIIPSGELVLHSVRAQTSVEFVGSYSFPPRNFIHLLLPYVNVGKAVSNWEFSCYMGVLPLALAVAALIPFRGGDRRAFAAVGAVALLIMLGIYTPVFPLLLKVIPGLKLFRIHARAEIGLLLSLAILSGMGWEAIFEADPEHSRGVRKKLAAACGIFAIVAGAVAIGFRMGEIDLSFDVPAPSAVFGFLVNQGGPITSVWHPRMFLPLIAISFSLAAALLLVRRCDNHMKYLLAGLVVVDLFALGLGRIRMVDLDYVTQEDGLVQAVKKDTSEYFRVWFPLDVFFGSAAKYFEICDVNGHNALGLSIFETYLESLTGVSPVRQMPYYRMDPRVYQQYNALFENVLNVKYFWHKGEGEEPVLYRAESVFPRVFFVSDYLVRPPEDFLTMTMDSRSMVMLHEQPPLGRYGLAEPAKARVVIDSYSNDEIRLSVTAPGDGLVVLSEIHYPGWRAEVDGVETNILRGDYLLRVVPVKTGEHKVRVYFAPTSLLLGKLITAGTALAVAGAFLYLRSTRRRPAPTAQDNRIESAEDKTQQ